MTGGLREKTWRIVECSDTRAGVAFNLVVQALIVLSLVSFAVDTLPDLDPRVQRALDVLEVVTVVAFTAEYLLRLWVVERPIAFVLSFRGLVDLAAVLPYYLALGVDLRSVRAMRLFRLFRAFKLTRYSRALDRFRTAFREVRPELGVFLAATVVAVFLSSVGIYYAENDAQPDKFASVFHAMWWAVTTLTTVGYGDMYPVTVLGRLFTTAVLFVGLGLVAVPPALLASALTQTLQRERRAEDGMAAEGEVLRAPSDEADAA